MKAGVTAINCIKNTSFRAILRLFGRAAMGMQAQAQLSGAVRIRRLATSLARPGSGGGTVLCIELCLSTAARASSIYFSRPPHFLILIRQRVTQLH